MPDTTSPDVHPVSPQSQPRHDTESEKTVNIEPTPSSLLKIDDPVPDGGYGWVCVACNFFINGKKNTVFPLDISGSRETPATSNHARSSADLG